MRFLIAIVFSTLLFVVQAQETPATKEYKLGIKTGVNLSTLLGSELKNPRPRFGYSAGAYWQKPFKKNKRLLQIELLANFKGSNFANPVGNYQSIPIFALDMPILYGITFNKKHHILAGPQFGYMGLASMLVSREKGIAVDNNVGLQPFLLDAVVAYQYSGLVVGYQASLKSSLLDMNENVYFEDIFPETGNGGTIRSLSLELALIF